MELSKELEEKPFGYQKNEITPYRIYRKLAKMLKSDENREVLEQITSDELQHYWEWKR